MTTIPTAYATEYVANKAIDTVTITENTTVNPTVTVTEPIGNRAIRNR